MNCSKCNGTGRDDAKTQDAIRRGVISHPGSYVRCWDCNGNGLEPVYPNSYVSHYEAQAKQHWSDRIDRNLNEEI